MSGFKKDGPTPPAPLYSDRSFLHAPTAAVTVPLSQSAVTGVIIFCVALTFALKFRLRDALFLSFISGLLTFALMWLWSYRRWISLTALEKFLGRDLNQDGAIGEKPKKVTRIRIEDVRGGRYQSNDLDLPAEPEQLQTLASGLLNGLPFSERYWAGRGKLFSSSDFRTLQDEMERRLLIELRDEEEPRQGYVLTEKGVQVMQGLAVDLPEDFTRLQ